MTPDIGPVSESDFEQINNHLLEPHRHCRGEPELNAGKQQQKSVAGQFELNNSITKPCHQESVLLAIMCRHTYQQ